MVPRRVVSYVGLAVMLAFASGCATTDDPKVRVAAAPGGYSASSPDQSDSATSRNVSGVWEGTGLTDCTEFQEEPHRCNAVVNVTLTMLQEQERVTGFYRCATGTVMCRRLLETGVIKAGSMTGRLLRFRVMLEDGESCIFQATPPARPHRGRVHLPQRRGDHGTRALGSGARVLNSTLRGSRRMSASSCEVGRRLTGGAPPRVAAPQPARLFPFALARSPRRTTPQERLFEFPEDEPDDDAARVRALREKMRTVARQAAGWLAVAGRSGTRDPAHGTGRSAKDVSDLRIFTE